MCRWFGKGYACVLVGDLVVPGEVHVVEGPGVFEGRDLGADGRGVVAGGPVGFSHLVLEKGCEYKGDELLLPVSPSLSR